MNNDVNIVEWVSDCCLTPNELFFSYIMARTSYIRWDDNDISFIIDRQTRLVEFLKC
jgi:hypothetical protein